MSEKFYRNTDKKLFKVFGGWFVLAEDIEQVMGLATKRSGAPPNLREVELIEHNATVIEGVYNDYESVCISNSEEIEKLKTENKLLAMCQCGEFDVEFNRHCNSCVKDRIEKLENAVAEANEIFKYVIKEEIPDVPGCAQWLEKYPIGDAPTYLTIREVEKLETRLSEAEKVINNILAVCFSPTGGTKRMANRIIIFIREYRSKYDEKPTP